MGDGAFWTALALRLLGALAGAVLALVFQPPKTRTEFIRRASLSLICGIIFGDVVRDYLKWLDTWQMNLASSAGTSLLSWFLIGAAIRVIGRWTPPKERGDE